LLQQAQRRVETTVAEEHRPKIFLLEADVTDARLPSQIAECVQVCAGGDEIVADADADAVLRLCAILVSKICPDYC
jgi:hypothetical protein